MHSPSSSRSGLHPAGSVTSRTRFPPTSRREDHRCPATTPDATTAFAARPVGATVRSRPPSRTGGSSIGSGSPAPHAVASEGRQAPGDTTTAKQILARVAELPDLVGLRARRRPRGAGPRAAAARGRSRRSRSAPPPRRGCSAPAASARRTAGADADGLNWHVGLRLGSC